MKKKTEQEVLSEINGDKSAGVPVFFASSPEAYIDVAHKWIQEEKLDFLLKLCGFPVSLVGCYDKTGENLLQTMLEQKKKICFGGFFYRMLQKTKSYDELLSLERLFTHSFREKAALLNFDLYFKHPYQAMQTKLQRFWNEEVLHYENFDVRTNKWRPLAFGRAQENAMPDIVIAPMEGVYFHFKGIDFDKAQHQPLFDICFNQLEVGDDKATFFYMPPYLKEQMEAVKEAYLSIKKSSACFYADAFEKQNGVICLMPFQRPLQTIRAVPQKGILILLQPSTVLKKTDLLNGLVCALEEPSYFLSHSRMGQTLFKLIDYKSRVTDESSLDAPFWSQYRDEMKKESGSQTGRLSSVLSVLHHLKEKGTKMPVLASALLYVMDSYAQMTAQGNLKRCQEIEKDFLNSSFSAQEQKMLNQFVIAQMEIETRGIHRVEEMPEVLQNLHQRTEHFFNQFLTDIALGPDVLYKMKQRKNNLLD